MNLELSSLSDDQSLAKQQALLLFSQLEEKYQVQEEKHQTQIDYLEEQNRLLRNELFGRRSEKGVEFDHNQLTLFTNTVEDPDRPSLVYQYHPSRSGQVAVDFIGSDYQGYVQSDAFSGYDCLEKCPGIVQLGCWAHVRRKFVDVIKAKKKIRSNRNPKSLADEALVYIKGLYRIEKQAREQGFTPEQIAALRQAEAKPILDKFKTWLEAKKPIVPPKSLLGKAIDYALSNWQRLIVYIEDGRFKPDNNAAENAIRPFVVGRKNCLFAGHPRGAEASATFFSLIETAKANGLEPYAYLRYLFENLPLIDNEDEYRSLLPQYIDKDLISHA